MLRPLRQHLEPEKLAEILTTREPLTALRGLSDTVPPHSVLTSLSDEGRLAALIPLLSVACRDAAVTIPPYMQADLISLGLEQIWTQVIPRWDTLEDAADYTFIAMKNVARDYYRDREVVHQVPLRRGLRRRYVYRTHHLPLPVVTEQRDLLSEAKANLLNLCRDATDRAIVEYRLRHRKSTCRTIADALDLDPIEVHDRLNHVANLWRLEVNRARRRRGKRAIKPFVIL